MDLKCFVFFLFCLFTFHQCSKRPADSSVLADFQIEINKGDRHYATKQSPQFHQNLGYDNRSNKWNVVADHGLDTVECMSNEGDSTSSVQNKTTRDNDATDTTSQCQRRYHTFLIYVRMKIWFCFDLMFHPKHIRRRNLRFTRIITNRK